MNKILRLLVVQRISLSHDQLMSRSIAARFGPLLNHMKRHRMIEWEEILEGDIGVAQLKRFDVVLFNKHTSNHALVIMRIANDLGLQTIYDLDDWILDLPTYSVTNLNDDALENIITMIREATIATVSNRFLQEKLQRIRSTVDIIYNGFDHEAISAPPDSWKETNQQKIIFSNTDGLKLVKFKHNFIDMLSVFMSSHPEVTLDFWGDPFPEMNHIPRVVPRGFMENTQYKLAIRDEGYLFAIVPLGGKEDPETFVFNSCKSPIKYIDYGSLGIPGIYSESPVYMAEVKHKVTGYLVPNETQAWDVAMNDLYENASLRHSFRHCAYEDTLSRFNIHTSSLSFLSILTRRFNSKQRCK
jgi:glycosyltransferase involved in cell wall biosynthesis